MLARVCQPRLPLTGLAIALSLLATPLWSQPADPVDAGREALRRSGRYPWYDREQDALRPVDVRPDKDIAGLRNSRWEPAAPKNYAINPPQLLWSILEGLMWVLIASILLGLVAAIVWAVVNRERSLAGQSDTQFVDSARADAERVENLPFNLDAADLNLLEEARRSYEANDFQKAVIYLFSYQLVELDKHHWIRLARGKTNRQYLREIRRVPEIRHLLERTMVAFEDVFFGKHVLDRARFEQCWNNLARFHELTQQVTS